MSLLDRLFRKSVSPATTLLNAIANLQIGIVTDLIIEYGARSAHADVVSLAGAVLSEAVMEPSTSAEVATFSRAHSTLVHAELMRLNQNAGVAGALSCLYAAKTLQLALVNRSPLSKEVTDIGDRATELGIYIPNTYDICGSGDAIQCVLAIGEFAENYRDRAFGR